MRVSEYKIINDMCSSIIDAINYIKNSGDFSMWKDCIETLSAILKFIESSSDKNSLKTISGAVSELINEIALILDGNGNTDKAMTYALNLSQKCKDDIKYKLRVLFVAELGGKWDAMSSVYEEFSKRDDCIVDVVIEPVFRVVKYEDGSTKNDIIYHDYLTPLGIKNIPYNNYSIEKIRPDITFFSQPYEGCTIPMFWPENMAKYTRVVYLPYYLCRDMKRTPFESFFLLKTQQFSWRIVCQSETMKKYYEIYASRKGENAIVTGIPKWDYPLRLNKNNTPCPKKWKKKLKTRKVFLLNTHFTRITEGETPFANITNIIDIFIKKQNVALIWRPHPMAETVIKLYTPHLYPIYKQIIKEIESSENIVIDNYATYDNAFVWSDALISGGSSIDVQYILMDKPCGNIMFKSKEEIYNVFYSIDKLWDYTKQTYMNSCKELEEFVDSICAGSDPTAEGRKFLREKFLNLADGNVGKRVVQKVIEDYFVENGLKAIKSEDNNCTLIIGSEADSIPCIKQLEESNKEYYICNDYIKNKDYTFEVKYISINDLKESNFANVIITDKKNESIIYELISNVYRVPKNKILRFWKMYKASLPVLHCDRVLMNPKTESYDGLIIGISHTEVGIIAEDLKKPFVNLALSSQDLFYQLKTLEYCIKKYPQKFSNLKYAIIDLYDYKYFNYDCSCSKSALKYLSYGGYNLDAHNFALNKNYNCTFDEAIEAILTARYNGLTNAEFDIWDNLFKNVYEFADYKGFEPNFVIKDRIKVVSDSEVETYVKPSGNIRNVFKKTIKDNVHYLELIFEKLRTINKNLKIYTIIIPKYIKTEIAIQERMSNFSLIFNEILDNLHEKYEFTMLDFNKISDISLKKEFYFDAAHLNYFGAKWLTEKLNEIIFKNENDNL